ncbi:MAG: site-specific DNA-methyltransferase [Syntrophaceae bacterium]|nr:site-specific DNA-methyltransferase [Syntrophaceae bacterium]
MLRLNDVYCGDCLEMMKQIDDNSIDTIITDPPYGINFMGKKWDYDVPSIEVWQECLRVLKPGGTALIFAGSRTQHRMAVNIEDAGFILKDCIMWLYGSGFPKAMDISKELDKKAGAEREIIGSRKAHDIRSNNLMEASQGKGRGTMEYHYTAPATDEAKKWNGWKSHGLKPAYEPIIVAMKPNDGGYAENAVKYGVSGLNIDGARIPLNDEKPPSGSAKRVFKSNQYTDEKIYGDNKQTPEEGRFPANVILDEEAGQMLDKQSGISKSTGGRSGHTKAYSGGYKQEYYGDEKPGLGDVGGASRFFYCAKASKKERDAGLDGMEEKPCGMMEDDNYPIKTGSGNLRNTKRQNHHPTVKPLKLMEYLCILTKTPAGGIVLDPFAGSGTTGIACKNTGRSFLLIEIEPQYVEIAKKRIGIESDGEHGCGDRP